MQGGISKLATATTYTYYHQYIPFCIYTCSHTAQHMMALYPSIDKKKEKHHVRSLYMLLIALHHIQFPPVPGLGAKKLSSCCTTTPG